jgi:hypothetical protein
MWEVHYSQEAATYLEDNATLIADLFFALESLVSFEGIPPTGSFQEAQGFIYWNIKDHLVVLRRIERLQIARILFIKPD